MLDNEAIDKAITDLAILLLTNQHDEFRETASLGKQINLESLEHLRFRFHTNPTKPEDYSTSSDIMFGEWMMVCQYSIFELIFNMKEDTIPFLESVAFGDYDWTQSTAIVTICRLVEAGRANTSIIARLDQEMAEMRSETIYYAGRDLFGRAKHNPNFLPILKQLTVYKESLEKFLEA